MHKAATRHDSTRKHYPQPDAIIKQSQIILTRNYLNLRTVNNSGV